MKIIRYISFLSFLLLGFILTSCQTNESEKAAYQNLIPQDKFTEILAECQLAESQVSVLRVEQPIFKDSILNYYSGIFNTYNVSSLDFFYSLQEYSKDQRNLDSIYSNVLVILNKKSTELGDVEIPKSNLNAISRQQLGDILFQTPISNFITTDFNKDVSYLKDTLMNYIDSNTILLEDAKVNRDSFEFTFIINTSTSIMYNQLRDYLVGKSNPQTD